MTLLAPTLAAPTLNLVAAEHEPLRPKSVELASGSPERVIALVRGGGSGLRRVGLKKARLKPRRYAAELPFEEPSPGGERRPTYRRTLDTASRHALEVADVDPRRLESVPLTTYERAPQDFETLIGMEGVGARTLHGGKDGTPFKVDALKRLGRFAKSTEPRNGQGLGPGD